MHVILCSLCAWQITPMGTICGLCKTDPAMASEEQRAAEARFRNHSEAFKRRMNFAMTQQTVTPIENERKYASKGGLKNGLIAAGLGALKYDVREVTRAGKHGPETGYAATVFVHNAEDKHYVQRKGFTAVVDTTRAAV